MGRDRPAGGASGGPGRRGGSLRPVPGAGPLKELAGLGLTDDHLALAATARRWMGTRSPVSSARAAMEAESEPLPSFWAELAGLGWLGLAVSEEHGGEGHGLAELAVVLEVLGQGCVPGPFLPTVVAAVAIDRWAGDGDQARSLVDGSRPGGLALGGALVGEAIGSELRVSGTAPVLGGAVAGRVLVPVAVGAECLWCVVDRERAEVSELPSFDATRRMARITLDGVDVAPSHRLVPRAPVTLLAGVLGSAEAVGVAAWCVEEAARHARTRVQFGRPIGQFQAVKHRCADMVSALEAARAAVWDSARCFGDDREQGWALAADTAVGLAPEAAFMCAKSCIQVLGGIGYTWEHDAHLYLKRATVVRHLLDAPGRARAGRDLRGRWPTAPAERDAARRSRRVSGRRPLLRPGPEGAALGEWTARLAESGYLVPHWPRPWGLDAGPLEQLAVDAELRQAGVRRPHLQVAGWALPTIIAHGTAAQQDRWILPSLRGEIRWCQMFSEPDAGSDLASLTTRAVRVEGGWSLTGQKVWTTLAHEADWAICLARTDLDAPKHEGIGCFLLDMATPGIDVRPLRELTGMALFNEIFLTDVFVPDDCVIGAPNRGWECARTTLANERVSMASGSSFGPGLLALFALADRCGSLSDPLVRDRLGGLVLDAHAIAMLGLRSTLRALGGGPPGPEASVRKLLGVEHEQAVQEAGLALLGPAVAVTEGEGATWTGGFLGNRALSIAGGTSEIQRNVIAEGLLGLPKDP
ncbi:MAG: acyl-CoA dehydrogenase [Acidimicrobiales bacterium]